MIEAILGAAVAAGYVGCVRLYRARYPERTFGNGRVVAFCAGCAIAVAALLPPVDAMVDRSFAAHMVQHLVLALIVPPLLLMGAPLLLLVALPPPRFGRTIARFVRQPMVMGLLSPVAAWIVFVAVLWGIHFSPLYQSALRFEAVHVAEHALLLAASMLFWMPVVQIGYSPHPVAFPVRMLYVVLAIPQGAFLGLAIYASPHVLYAHYLLGRSAGAALADQQDAGAIMWIGGGAVLFAAFMLTAGRWAAREHREVAAA